MGSSCVEVPITKGVMPRNTEYKCKPCWEWIQRGVGPQRRIGDITVGKYV